MTTASRQVMRVTEVEALRRYWYPVVRADAVAEQPVARKLLGVELVLWRSAGGSAVAAVDRCPHRDARLSDGWLDGCALVCPYHGWEYGVDGKASRIPQLDEGVPVPPTARLDTVATAERYGWIWACLQPDDEVALPIPEVTEYHDPAWRVVHEPESDWACPSPMLVENNLDPAHIAFVHKATFGSPTVPQVPIADVARTPTGMRSANEVPVQSRPGESGATVRRTVTTVYGPSLLIIAITYPDGIRHTMVKACTPVDDTTTHQLQMVLRNDSEADRAAADIVAFDAAVWVEDRAVLERAHHDYTLDLTANVHLKVDKPSIEYRRLLADIVGGTFPPQGSGEMAPAGTATVRPALV